MSLSTTESTTAPTGGDDNIGVIHLQQGISRTVKISSSNDAAGSFDSIPIIDMSGMYSESLTERQKLAAVIRDACTKVGFMQIANHGINWEIVETAMQGAKEFFELPLDVKMKVYQHKSPHFLGYEPLYETNVNMLRHGGEFTIIYILTEYIEL
jgi:Isopenicillin N synthase and related dioxygenases